MAAAYEVIVQYERELSEQLIGGLLEIPGLTFYGIKDPAKFDQRTPTVAIRMEGYTPRELAEHLGERGIFTWDGNYYAVDLAERLGVQKAAACCASAWRTTTPRRKSTVCWPRCERWLR